MYCMRKGLTVGTKTCGTLTGLERNKLARTTYAVERAICAPRTDILIVDGIEDPLAEPSEAEEKDRPKDGTDYSQADGRCDCQYTRESSSS